MYTHLEEYIYRQFLSIGIRRPDDLDMHTIARRLGVEIVYRERPFRFDNEVILVRSTEENEWMEFGHEICHYLRHCGSQVNMHPLFIELQEWQAENFAYHFCVPTFMLNRIRLPPDRRAATALIAETFNVDYHFAAIRLDRYVSNFNQGGFLVAEKQSSFH